MKLSPMQIKGIKNSTKRLNILEGAVRSSKTWGSLIRWIQFVGNLKSPEACIIAARTERAAVRNIVRPLQRFLGNDNCIYYPGKAEFYIFDKCCYVLGANDIRSEGRIRGLTAAGAYGDELTLWPEAFFKMLLSRLSEPGAQFFGTTNPDNPYHFLKKDYIDRNSELDMYVQHYELDDNPFLSSEFKANLKKEYRGLWYKRFIEGLWCMAEGAVYDMFDERLHVIDKLPVAKSKVVCIDYGTGNPTCFLLMGLNMSIRPKAWIEREYYYDSQQAGRQKTDSEYANDLLRFVGDEPVSIIILDPSAASFKAEIQRKNRFIIRNADNEVLTGIRTQAKMLTNGEYKIHKSCEHTIKDYGAYMWDANAVKRGEDKPLKQNDHTKDAERYGLYSMFNEHVINYDRLLTM